MALLHAAASLVSAVGEIDLPLAHSIGYPHQEPVRKSGGGNASAIVIAAVIVATLALAGGLFWVRERVRRAEAAEAEAASEPAEAAPDPAA